MRRTAIVGGILCTATLVLAGCGAGPTGSTLPSATSSTRGPDADAVEQVFRGYYEALLARDFSKACAYNAPETTKALLQNMRSRNISASSCDDALRKIYATPGTAAAADKILSTSEVTDVKITGENATVTFSTEQDGKRQSATSTVRKIDGEWKLVDTD